ncbi:MarR family winged helix-turn-helix transcriptional regulator [Pseudonocardia sp. KRD291]|uniref:MarR family winged helix-turn-helix transcriptional regulator n=1 Tax=Pseudonocardia sp. KRD291 TaxID=2792007 RepID=UPI001C4A2939|nr:MarR family winged helix-turn-helix transcriptional regulator [Pseudonocardia sp. KRD291]MBW0104756.1 winged helix-turn-helix transcriptional regulator [Pseudonocardia sp. KRD291]
MPYDDVPLWELIQTSHVVARGFHRVFAEAGLTATQFGVLAELDDRESTGGPAPSQAELARVTLLRPQSVGELVASLVERGLVRRDGPAGRGRRTGLELTDAGRGALHRAFPLVQAFNTPTAMGLDAGEARELTRMMRRVRETLDGAENATSGKAAGRVDPETPREATGTAPRG